MPGLVELGFSLVLTGAGPWAFYHGFKALRVQQLIRDTPTARVRSMAIGLVEVNGVLIPRSRTVAPFSSRPCAWWGVEIQTLSSKSRSGTRSWSTVHKAESGHPFYLRDETGLALVYPQGADCKVGYDVGEETTGLGVPQMYMDFMASRGLAMRHLWALGPMRFRERRLEEGYGVYVLGRANPKSVSRSVSFDEEALAATGTESVGAAHVRTLDDEVCAVIRRGPRDPAFIISTTSERMEAMKYGFKAVGGLIGGPLMTVFGLWCLLELTKLGH
jgi:E3 Ubiquitin ligase